MAWLQIIELMKTCNTSSTDESTSDSSASDDTLTLAEIFSFVEQEEEDNDDALLLPLLHYIINGQRRHRIEDYLQVIDSWTEQEFKQHLRLTRGTATMLIHELEISHYIPSHSFGMKPVSAKLSFLLFLWYIANTEPLRTMSDRFNVSISSVFRIIRRVIAWLLTKFDMVIKWPQDHDDIAVVCEKFRVKQGIPNVLGAIDSTHIRIVKPANNARDYCN